MRRLFVLILGVCLGLPAAHAARDDKAGAPPPLSPVQQLIAELGSDQYAVRRRAEEKLIRMGPEAFDELKAAESHEDDEIAERARYIIQRIRVEWVHPADAVEVRRLLTRFGDLSEDNRQKRISQLGALDDRAGLPALCRIARFDPSPLVARHAAAAILRRGMSAAERNSLAAACLGELGTSERSPTAWIRLYFRELDDADSAGEEWLTAIDAEIRELSEQSPDTDFEIVRQLLARRLEQYRTKGSADYVAGMLFRIVDVIAEQLDRCRLPENRTRMSETLYALARWGVDYNESDAQAAGIAWALRWIIKAERWDALDPVEARYEAQFRKQRKLLYYLAAAVRRAGREERAAQLADQAFALLADDDNRRVTIAESIAELGFVDWAEREYRRAIKEYPVVDERSMEARNDLAMWLHDREDYQGAADVLGEFCDALDADPAARDRLIKELEMGSSSGREVLHSVAARRAFYLACVDEAGHDYARQRSRLEEAIKQYDRDPDILIAMYRSKDAGKEFKQRTQARIRATAKSMQAQVDEYPDIPTFYNQWAWLIANTEGDQQLAVKYSLRSLELAPDEPSYLDTLGRCYYAVGDLENAVKSQRRAVELAPHYRVMRRQLALFEQALVKKSTTETSGDEAAKDSATDEEASGEAAEGGPNSTDDSALAPPGDSDPGQRPTR